MQVRTFSARFSPGHAIEKHSHRWSQLLFASEGVLAVESQVACWIVPTHRAIWIPAGVEHALKMHGRTFLQTVYFESHFAILKPLACGAYEISPLMRELILYACSKGIIHGETEEDRNLIDFLAYQVCQLSPFPWKIPMPRDDRARRLAQRIIELPGTEESLRDLCQSIGSSLRTMQRVFSSELAIPLSRWRNQVKMVHAIQWLQSGRTITQIALDLGYESTSAFIFSFRQHFGVAPGQYRSRQIDGKC